MRSCKRSVMAIAMLVVISMPMIIFIYWKIQRQVIRHEMKEKLEHASLQTIELHTSDVEWYEANREIIVQGKLFDVVSQSKVTGTDIIRFTGLFDEAETELEYKAGRLLREKEKNEPGEELLAQAVWIFSSPLSTSPELASLYYAAKTPFNMYTTASFPLADLSIPAPPPKA